MIMLAYGIVIGVALGFVLLCGIVGIAIHIADSKAQARHAEIKEHHHARHAA